MTPRKEDRLSGEDYRIFQKLEAAMGLLEAGRDKDAAKQLRSIIHKHPAFRPALFHLHTLCLEHNWHDLLLDAIQDAHHSGKWDSDLLEDLVFLSFSLKRLEETRRYLNEFMILFPRRRKIGPWRIKDMWQWVLFHTQNQREASPSPDQMMLWSGGDDKTAPRASARTPSKPSRPAPAAKPPVKKPTNTKPPAATAAPVPPPAETILLRPILGPLQVTITVEGPDLVERLAQGEWNVRSHHDLCLSAHHLSMVNGIDELLCLSNIQGVRELWYQVETV
ncbi:MAG: hypothetical protein KJ970_16435, partial [Candidatus Eisenbacteria bacterium]|nr:hypothetical protein [Candidatus Eisenbacteria bacterium]